MINPKQLRDLVARTLKRIPNGHSDSSELAVLMIASHESKLGTYLRQTNGPALGLGQVEPITHDDVWVHGDTCADNAKTMGIVRDIDKLECCLVYQIFIIRQRLFMKPEALPPADDLMVMAEYLKKHWNTVHGKAMAHDYYFDYLEFYGDEL